MRISCAFCKNCLDLEKHDYTGEEVVHKNMNGYICIGLAKTENKADWIVGTDKERCSCGLFDERSS